MKFSIAGFYTKYHILDKVLNLYKNNQFMFRNEVVIDNLYDSLGNLKWSGGRINRNRVDYSIIKNNIEKVNNLGIGVSIVFTNFYIDKVDLLDDECNKILQFLSNNNLNGVIVASQVLAEYISTQYPTIKIKLSLTHFYQKEMNIIESFNNVLNDKNSLYDAIVLPSDYNRYDFYHDSTFKSKIEILVNETCYENCPFKREHYSLINKDIQNNTNISKDFCHSKFHKMDNEYRLLNKFSDLSFYRQLKIEKYKISGRTSPDDEFIVYLGEYLIKEAYLKLFFSYFKSPLKSLNDICLERYLTW